jgi:hypothetical protein
MKHEQPVYWAESNAHWAEFICIRHPTRKHSPRPLGLLNQALLVLPHTKQHIVGSYVAVTARQVAGKPSVVDSQMGLEHVLVG